MNKFFDNEGPLMLFLSKVADLVWLNVLTFLCCIPIITAGASLTAMYTVTIKMVNKEEGYISRNFFQAFKKNFKQATIIWGGILLLAILFYGDYRIVNYSGIVFPKALPVALTAVMLLLYCTFLYLFPVLARYDNSIKNTIKNSFLLSISNLPKTIVMIAINLALPVAVYFSQALFPILFLLGLTLPAYLSSLLFVGIFKKIELGLESDLESNGEEEDLH